MFHARLLPDMRHALVQRRLDSLAQSGFRRSFLTVFLGVALLRRRARSTLAATSESIRMVRSGCKSPHKMRCRSRTGSATQFATASLVGFGGVGEAVAEHDAAFRQRGLNDFRYVLGARGEHQGQFRQRGKARTWPNPEEGGGFFLRSRSHPVRALPLPAIPARGVRRASLSICVLLPHPSRPSKVMNLPR